MSDRRQHKRVACRMQVNVYDATGEKQIALCRNISIAGLGLEGDFTLKKDDVVGMEFSMPYLEGFKFFRIKGKVIDTLYRGSERKVAINLAFVNLDTAMKDVIQNYVKDRVGI